MRKFFGVALIFGIICFSLQSSNAQKIAYLNSAYLLSQMEEVKMADKNLEAFQQQIQKRFQSKVEAFQAKVVDFQNKEKAGQLSKVQMEAEGKKLQDEQTTLAQEEQDLAKQVQERREKELQPILEKVNKVIGEVAKEKGYSYVMDSSTPILLYADETNDLSKAVAAKLGVTLVEPPKVDPTKAETKKN